MKKFVSMATLLVATSVSAQIANKIPEIDAMPLSKVEVVHWDCDYMATVNMLDFGEAAICSAAFERIKAEKFGGDFNKMLAWWKENKTKQHALRSNK